MDHGILVAGLLSPSTLIAFMKGAAGLGFVIFVHELGHFLVAKACGVKCEKFYVGFDPPIQLLGFQLPRTLFKKQWGETEYGVGIVPLGGYVKMLGQDDNPANAAAEAERIQLSGEQLDPRSYPAKSVIQRMMIISAGVVFNLLFAILFATAAYKMGVRYMPTVIGGTSAGDPAWLAGIAPGDRIVSLEADKPIDDRLRFREDLKLRMVALDPGDTIDMQLRDEAGEIRRIQIEPNSGYTKQVSHPTIGVWMAQGSKVYGVMADSIAEKAGLLPGDQVTAITVDDQRTEIPTEGPGTSLQRALARSQHKPIVLSVSRVDPKTEQISNHEIKLDVGYAERFGLELGMGPIVCMQNDSVAMSAGLQVGDILTHVDGEPIGDPLTLPLRSLNWVGKAITLTVNRAGKSEDISLTPRAPSMLSEVRRRNGPIGIDTLGIGFVMNSNIDGVVAESPAMREGIQAGDVLKSVKVAIPGMIPDEDRLWGVFGFIQEFLHEGGLKHRKLRRTLEAYELDKTVSVDADHNNWPFIVRFVQGDDNFAIDLTYERSGVDTTVRLEPEVSETMLDTSRGFALEPYEELRKAATMGEAFSLGYREVWEGMKQVVLVLRKIGANHQNLGGPIMIAAAATAEASEGLPRLLTFLTLLSANLAVLNFLPIPVLDGGHMLFLAYEGIVGKPVNERLQMGLTLVGFSMLMGLMIYVFGLDISRFLG